MEHQYLQITFDQVPVEQQEILIAQLSEIGFTGFDESGRQLAAFIPLSGFDEARFNDITANRFPSTRLIIEQKNWNEEWERSFSPVIVDDYCVIRASFHLPVAGFTHEIVITPKMSFGTGHHATTYQMIQLMRGLDFNGQSVLDFGTGTGVLSILAEKSGASHITAIDNDPWSIDNALENSGVNNCRNISILLADELAGTEKFDIILANINKHVILSKLASIEQHLAAGGVLLLSGLLDGDKKEIDREAAVHGLRIDVEQAKDNWIALLLSRR